MDPVQKLSIFPGTFSKNFDFFRQSYKKIRFYQAISLKTSIIPGTFKKIDFFQAVSQRNSIFQGISQKISIFQPKVGHLQLPPGTLYSISLQKSPLSKILPVQIFHDPSTTPCDPTTPSQNLGVATPTLPRIDAPERINSVMLLKFELPFPALNQDSLFQERHSVFQNGGCHKALHKYSWFSYMYIASMASRGAFVIDIAHLIWLLSNIC